MPNRGKEIPDTAFLFNAKDWITSTRGFSLETKGIFIDLLAFAWDYDGLPDDPKTLAKLCGVHGNKFRRIWTELEPKFPLAEEGKRRNPRQEAARAAVKDYRERQRRAGRKGARKRWKG